MHNKLFVGTMVFLILAMNGCITEGRVSGHGFIVATNRGDRTPTTNDLRRMIDSFADSHGFVRLDPLIPELSNSRKVMSFRYILQVDHQAGNVIELAGSYTTKATGVVVDIHGTNNSACQKAADKTYEDFRSQFCLKYNPKAISDNLLTTM